MKRNHTIDTFRGIAIIGMVFFTLTRRLSSNLPDVLRHNIWESVHLGDFILPMFLFASGLSLAYYLDKKKEEKTIEITKNIGKRYLKLAIVGVSLSIFSAYGFLEMDEVMLSALLFIACVGLSKLDLRIIPVIIVTICISYIVLIQFNYDTIFIGHYLGGYPAAVYYLPIMLVGLSIGKSIISENLWCTKNIILIFLIFIFFILFSIFIPFNKMTATPPFILLSILFSFIIFSGIHFILTSNIHFNQIEYIGKNPLRYWLMMYFFFLIPVWFYSKFFNKNPLLDIQWYGAILLSCVSIVILWRISYLIDYVTISN
jgi:hypothetical protein